MKHAKHALIESLESRRLMSAGGFDAQLLDEMAFVPTVVSAHATPGPITGTLSKRTTNPDVGEIFHFSGSGSDGSAGTVTLTGNVHLPGNISQGHSHGNFVLTYNNGATQTLHLQGKLEPGFGPLPTKLHYDVTATTGTHAGVATTGIILIARSAGHHFSITFQ